MEEFGESVEENCVSSILNRIAKLRKKTIVGNLAQNRHFLIKIVAYMDVKGR